MNFVTANIAITAMAVTFVLLAIQAEPITATFGYVWAGVLFLAVIRQTLASQKENEDA